MSLRGLEAQSLIHKLLILHSNVIWGILEGKFEIWGSIISKTNTISSAAPRCPGRLWANTHVSTYPMASIMSHGHYMDTNERCAYLSKYQFSHF